MALTLSNLTLLLAALATGLCAGLFYAYSCSVNPGLHQLPDASYLSAMQHINRAILNPVFFFSFLGAVVLLPLAAYLNYHTFYSLRFLCILSAAIIYLTGTFGVTIFGNVPLNNALDTFNIPTAGAQELLTQRTSFEGPWNKLHTIRTLAAIISFILTLVACLSKDHESFRNT